MAVAFSGGTDSTFLLKVAVDTLGSENVIALTASSPLNPKGERLNASVLAEEMGVARHIIVHTPDIKDRRIKHNPEDRCYHCKNEILSTFLDILKKDLGGGYVLMEGTNRDDLGEHRPGRRAVKELGVISPLTDLTKEEIREHSRALGLSNWDRPSQSCLATRIPHGCELLEEGLIRVDKGETFLKELGFKECRLRIHGELARVEVPRSDRSLFLEHSNTIVPALKELGFAHVTMDVE